MRRFLSVLSGLSMGAGLMYLLDPKQGRTRRALARDKAKHLARQGGEKTAAAARDVGNRARGIVFRTRRRLNKDAVRDDKLVARVRAEMGHHLSHPGAVEVEAKQGKITLSGAVVEGERDALMRTVRAVPGVLEVASHLETYEDPKQLQEAISATSEASATH